MRSAVASAGASCHERKSRNVERGKCVDGSKTNTAHFLFSIINLWCYFLEHLCHFKLGPDFFPSSSCYYEHNWSDCLSGQHHALGDTGHVGCWTAENTSFLETTTKASGHAHAQIHAGHLNAHSLCTHVHTHTHCLRKVICMDMPDVRANTNLWLYQTSRPQWTVPCCWWVCSPVAMFKYLQLAAASNDVICLKMPKASALKQASAICKDPCV